MGNRKSSLHHFFGDTEAKEFASLYDEKGFDAVISKIKEKHEDLEKEKLNIAVTGESGVGKSALINSMRGLRQGDPGAAEEGCVEQTIIPTEYLHPTLPNVYLWDLPGIGTTNFPSNRYRKLVKLDNYDVFIVLMGNRFKENDVLILNEIKKMNKQFYFVRSKIDIEVDNLKKQNRNDEIERELEIIRQECITSLKNNGFPSEEVFLVSSYRLNDFDFSKLCNVLESGLSENKRHVFVLALPNFSSAVIEKKKSTLHKRILFAAALSAGAGAIPVPGLSLVIDISIFVGLFQYIKKSFGLDDTSLKQLADKVGKNVEDLKAEVKNPFISGDITRVSVLTFLRTAATATAFGLMVAEEALHFIPIIGSLVGVPLSLISTYTFLKTTLDSFAEAAVRVIVKASEP